MRRRERFLAFYEGFKANDEKVLDFFDQLIIGKQSYQTLFDDELVPAVVYLHESIPQILIVSGKNYQEELFDLRSAQLQLHGYKYEMMNKQLSRLKYVLLTQQKQEAILIFPSADERQIFIKFVKVYSEQLKRNAPDVDALLLTTFFYIDKNYSYTISKSELQILMRMLKLTNQDKQLKRIIKFVRGLEEKEEGIELTFREFQRMMRLMECREELKGLFRSYTGGSLNDFYEYNNAIMKTEEFIRFLQKQQHEDNALLIKKTVNLVFKGQEKISFYQFCQYFFSAINNAYNAAFEEQDIDLNQPLTKYYCLSSHNTYLTGNQLTSDSRAERYLQDLEAGYRCLQIDIHNGPGKPIVKHGFTMTSSITFEQVIVAIRAFSSDPKNYNHTPIILSLQNHANVDQQKEMAKILLSNFPNKILLIKSFNLKGTQRSSEYPTLQECLGKIIIKNSGNFQYYQRIQIRDADKIQEYYEQQQEQAEQPKINEAAQKMMPVFAQKNEERQKIDQDMLHMKEEKKIFDRYLPIVRMAINNHFNFHTNQKKISSELIKLTAMLGSGSLSKPCIWESVSLSEGKIVEYSIDSQKNLKYHTERYWIRSYPAANRVNSSNYDPLPALQQGVQLIALNSQTSDHFSLLLRQFFKKSRTNCKGYRLKPKAHMNLSSVQYFYIKPLSCFAITQDRQTDEIPPIQVRMAFLGSSSDMRANIQHTFLRPYTQTIKNNAYNPVFQQTETLQLIITNIELAFLLLEVPECGIAVLPLQAARKGIRNINLISKDFSLKGSFVLLRIQ